MTTGLGAVVDTESVAEIVAAKHSRSGFLSTAQVREVAGWVLKELAGLSDEQIVDVVRRRRERE